LIGDRKMKKIAILGCENSHANNFLKEIKENPQYSDYEVVGVYSDEKEPCEKLKEAYGVPVLSSYDEAVGKIDGLIVTARHGANHYKYAKPYIDSGIPMFIDKPITINCDEAIEFMRVLRDKGIKVTGGSSLRQAPEIEQLREDVKNEVGGKTIGGVVRAPLSSDSPYGGFFFYAQHLVEMVLEVFGRYPNSVKAFSVNDQKTVVFRYDEYDIVGMYEEHSYKYFVERFSVEDCNGGVITSTGGIWFKKEFADFDALMNGGEQQMSYDDFIAPVFVMNAIAASLKSGNEENVRKFKV
jgi:predicted dehydrogenase